MLVRKHMPIIAALLSGVMALPLAASAAAEDRPVVVYAEPQDARTARINFADLDLTAFADQKRLHYRVGAAVEQVCQLELGRDGLQDKSYYACSDNAWGGATPKIADVIERSRDAALTGKSSIAATAITISAR